MTREQLREHVGHRPTVLDHVRDARRRAQVVFEHAEATRRRRGRGRSRRRACARRRRVEPLHAPVVVRGGHDEPARHDTVGEDLPRAVDVGEEPLERQHPLAHTGVDDRPLVGGDDPRHEVEGERPLLLAGELERDALVAERAVSGGAALLEVVARQRAEHGVQCGVVRPGRVDSLEHLVPGAHRLVTVKQVAHRLFLRRFGYGKVSRDGAGRVLASCPVLTELWRCQFRGFLTVAPMNEPPSCRGWFSHWQRTSSRVAN